MRETTWRSWGCQTGDMLALGRDSGSGREACGQARQEALFPQDAVGGGLWGCVVPDKR